MLRSFFLGSIPIIVLCLSLVDPISQKSEQLKIGSPAPAWSNLPGVDGKKYSLADLNDKEIVVVVFTCNSCPIAEGYEDRIIAFAKKHTGAKGKVALVAINVNTNKEDRLPKMIERAKDKEFNFPYLFDETQQIAKAYGAVCTPEFFVLDKERKIAYMGAMDDRNNEADAKLNFLEEAIQAVWKSVRPKVTETLPRGCLIRYTSSPSTIPTGPEAIFAPDAALKTLAGAGVGGEGPAWHPKLGLLTSGNGHICLLDHAGNSSIYRKGAGTNGLLFDRQGRLLACEPDLRRVTRTELDGKLTVLTDRFDGKRYNSPNDITVDSQSRIYFSDPRYGKRAGMEIRDANGDTVEGVYRIDPDGKVIRVIGREVERANGVLVSPDDRYLYVADNNNDTVGGARKLWRFDLRKDGAVNLSTKKQIYNWGQGRGPDGVKQDEKGRLFVAAGLNKPNPPSEAAKDVKGGIYVLSPEGQLLTFLPVPTDEVTNCAFGGADLRTLYITGGGTIYSIQTTTPGRVVWPARR
jgi:gluconolactonase